MRPSVLCIVFCNVSNIACAYIYIYLESVPFGVNGNLVPLTPKGRWEEILGFALIVKTI